MFQVLLWKDEGFEPKMDTKKSLQNSILLALPHYLAFHDRARYFNKTANILPNIYPTFS